MDISQLQIPLTYHTGKLPRNFLPLESFDQFTCPFLLGLPDHNQLQDFLGTAELGEKIFDFFPWLTILVVDELFSQNKGIDPGFSSQL